MASSSKTIDSVPDHLKCPICMDIPRDKVFQCVNGHPICDECYYQLTTCPHCRVPFGAQQIRNLVMENILDEMTLECPYKDSGCPSNVGRRSFQKHFKSCYFNTAMFGPLVKVCKILLFANACTFRMNKGNAREAIKHFEKEHGARITTSSSYNMELPIEILKMFEKGLMKKSKNPTQLQSSSRKLNIRTPIIVKGDDGQHFFLVLRMYDWDKGILSWGAYFFRRPHHWNLQERVGRPPSPPPYKVQCSLEHDERNRLTWNLSPVDILTVTELPLQYTIPMEAFVKQFSKDGKSLNVNIKIKKIKKTP